LEIHMAAVFGEVPKWGDRATSHPSFMLNKELLMFDLAIDQDRIRLGRNR